MASHAVTSKRIRAIAYIVTHYRGIINIPEESKTWNDWIFEICDMFECSRRTAIEYMYTARARIARSLSEDRDLREKVKEELKPIVGLSNEELDILTSSQESSTSNGEAGFSIS